MLSLSLKSRTVRAVLAGGLLLCCGCQSDRVTTYNWFGRRTAARPVDDFEPVEEFTVPKRSDADRWLPPSPDAYDASNGLKEPIPVGPFDDEGLIAPPALTDRPQPAWAVPLADSQAESLSEPPESQQRFVPNVAPSRETLGGRIKRGWEQLPAKFGFTTPDDEQASLPTLPSPQLTDEPALQPVAAQEAADFSVVLLMPEFPEGDVGPNTFAESIGASEAVRELFEGPGDAPVPTPKETPNEPELLATPPAKLPLIVPAFPPVPSTASSLELWPRR